MSFACVRAAAQCNLFSTVSPASGSEMDRRLALIFLGLLLSGCSSQQPKGGWLDLDMLLIQPGNPATEGIGFDPNPVSKLAPQDAEAIVRECPAVASAAPVVRARTQVALGSKSWVPLYIYGTTPEYLEVRDRALAEGQPFTEQDVRQRARVCLIGQTLVDELFPGESPVGKEVRMQNVGFRIIGVLGRKGPNMMGIDQDDIVLAPWTTISDRLSEPPPANTREADKATDNLYPNDLSKLYPNDLPKPVRARSIDQILARARSEDEVSEANRQITNLLRERHHIKASQPDDFNIRDMGELSRALASTDRRARTIRTWVWIIVGSTALVVSSAAVIAVVLVRRRGRTLS
jgi:ABC-type antimicrobial peptide transport system permease subunit